VVVVSDLVRGLISNEDQLDAALDRVRDHCLKSIADGTAIRLA